MRHQALKLIGSAALASALAGLSGSVMGCRSAVEDFLAPLTSGGAGGSGGTGGSGGLPLDCQGDPTKDASLVRDECGLFVDQAVATTGDGTKAKPFKSLGEAAKKMPSRIFVCAAGGPYEETATIELANGIEVYGGFGACPANADWTWDPEKRATVNGPENVPVVHVSMGASLIQSVNLTAPAATTAGASSIGIIADSTDLTLTDVGVTTGDGAAGENGAVPMTEAASGVDAAPDATPACNATQVAGKGAKQTCGDGDSLGGDGGKGGLSGVLDGEAGKDGSPTPDPNTTGLGGQPTGVPATCNGGLGGEGTPGEPGKGGASMGKLTLKGISGGDGEDGSDGARGQGGGGGAGSKAGMFCPPAGSPTQGPGASGGGGGSGGCGGKGGGGGKAGGSSIGIVSLSSTFTFSGVTITAGAGANGGNGVPGKGGAAGGLGAAGGASSNIGTSKAGCKGGDGGGGGNGGQGGGGRGGHSIGIAYTGPAPAIGETVTVTLGTAGDGGTGDSANMGDGAKGTSGEAVEIK